MLRKFKEEKLQNNRFLREKILDKFDSKRALDIVQVYHKKITSVLERVPRARRITFLGAVSASKPHFSGSDRELLASISSFL